jgi:hypothetical protein
MRIRLEPHDTALAAHQNDARRECDLEPEHNPFGPRLCP